MPTATPPSDLTAYTIGRLGLYLPLFRRNLTPTKLGFRPEASPNHPGGYHGGAVWVTADEARAYLQDLLRDPALFGVFELRLKAPWSLTVLPGEPYSTLLYDALIVRRVP